MQADQNIKKKILIFSLAYYPNFVSGAEMAIKEITDRIDPEDIEFHLITHRFSAGAARREQIGNVVVYRVGFGGAYLSKILFIPLAVFKARLLHKTHCFDGLWAIMTYMLLPIVLARGLGLHCPYALTLQDGDPYEKVFGRWFIRPFTPLLDYGFRNACIIQAISEYLGKWPERRGYRDQVAIIRNGADPGCLDLSYSVQELEAVKNSLKKQADDIYLFIAARLVYQKAQDIIIQSLTLLPERVHLLIAGSGNDEAMLKKLTAELGLEKRVRFLGVLERDDVPKYRNTIVSDIFVHPSRSEGLGNTILSAMAARLPVVTTQVGGLADYIFDVKRNPKRETTAWAVDVDSPEQIAEAVKDILVSPERVKQVVETARKMVEIKYNWEPISHAMRKRVFEKLFT